MKILLTGYAGFVGHSLCKKLLSEGISVVGIDNFNNYYDPNLKNLRHKNLIDYAKKTNSNFEYFKNDITDKYFLESLFVNKNFDQVIHLAAQAGVRHSISHPSDYLNNNLIGFFNIIDACKNYNIKKFIYASTSGVYGASSEKSMQEEDRTDLPIQFYAATKKCNEVIAHSYSSMYGIKSIGLRFFTVYGPWGRPDMAIFKFTQSIRNGQDIDLFNHGNHFRSFTYISDLVNMVYSVVQHKESSSFNKFEVFNIGNPTSVPLHEVVELISRTLGKKVTTNSLDLQPGDVVKTQANIDKFVKNIEDYNSFTDISTGIENFIKWYLDYENKLNNI